VATAWQAWVGSLLQGLISLLTLLIIGAFIGLAGVVLLLNTSPRWMAVVYIAAAILAALLRRQSGESFSRLLERNGMFSVASELQRILGSAQSVRIIAMGHNHQPTVERLDDGWYVNTGAWVPLYQREGPIEGREALTFLRLAQDDEGAPELLRWDDAGGAPTRMVLWQDGELVK
jgi:hypothetical protein